MKGIVFVAIFQLKRLILRLTNWAPPSGIFIAPASVMSSIDDGECQKVR
jgi:hypothetical protein